jgi:gliding motility-associated-like protein
VGAVATNQTTFPSESEGAFNWDFGNGETYQGYDVPYTINYVNNTDEVQYITISLEAVTDVGCAASFTRTIMVGPSACDERIAIPNIFTPNGDGLNDVLRPLILNEHNNYRPVTNEDGLKNYRMQVYNRWGELVFQSTDAEKGWEGSGFAEGVYYCNVQYQCNSFSKGKLNSIEVTLKH